MLTPVGNPQNLYIYSISNMSVGKFIGTMLPLSTVSLILVLILCITIKNKKILIVKNLMIVLLINLDYNNKIVMNLLIDLKLKLIILKMNIILL